MIFKVGDTVVYPHHGAALIEAIETRTIKGEQREYLVLKVSQGDLTVRVPADNAEYVGVRDVVGQEGLDKVFQVLRAPHTEEPTNWSRRYKANLEKLASGDVNKVAEVVRDLWRRDQERGLSAGEKRMLAKARQILVGELALAENTDDEKAETVTAFTTRALDWFLQLGICAERLMTDNAFAYTKNKTLKELLHRRAIQHIRTRPYTPRTNGKVERYQQTLQREWAYALEYASSNARRASLPHWVRHYNERRTHSALGNRPPIQRVRQVTGLDS